MKKPRIFTPLIYTIFAFSLLTGCSSKPSTRIDFNPKTNFSSFTSFQFSPQEKSTFDANPVMSKRLQSAVEQSLLTQGLPKIDFVDKESADLTIKVNFSLHEKANNSSFSIGLGMGKGSSHGGGSIGVSTSIPIDGNAKIITTITIDMSHQGKAVWHGVDSYQANNNLTIKEINSAVISTVNRMLANFPPETSNK